MNLILKNIQEVYEDTLLEFEQSEEIESYFKERESFEQCISQQKRLLEIYIDHYIHNSLHKDTKSMQQYEKFYLSLEFPYILVIKYLNILKKRAIKNLQEKSDISFEERLKSTKSIANCIDSLKNYISHIFIIKKAKDFTSQEESKFQEFQLFHHHLSWVKSIVGAIISQNLKEFPLVNSKECSYSTVMQYPESLMICIDASLCKQLATLHELVHQEAETFYRFCVKGEYLQAYFVISEFMENVEKLLSLLKDLYYLTHSDLENSFFQLLELLSYTDKSQILSVFDLEGVKKLNNRYGEKKLDDIIKSIEILLKEEYGKNPQNSLLIHGVSASFYCLNIGKTDMQEFQRKVEDFIVKINTMLEQEHPSCDIKFNIASFLLDKDVKYHKDELRRIILELKERAKDHGNNIFFYKKEEQDYIRKWLNERYFTIRFLQEKIRNKEVGIMLQPIYKIESDEIFAVEVLARIIDDGKLLAAGIFIDTLYEINLVTELDMLVLDAILDKKEYILEKDIKVFINSAANSLTDQRYIEKLYEFLENFPSDNIVVEITEQQALDNLDVLKTFHKKTKVKFAIDDFGTGYSALKTVSEMVEEDLIAVLKMDGSLIANLDQELQTQKIVKIIARMCETFDIYSLAEFIENGQTLELLKEFRVDLSQGYYVAKPMIAEELRVY